MYKSRIYASTLLHPGLPPIFVRITPTADV